LLVAPPGTGKSLTALAAADALVRRRLVDATLVISDRAILREQWRHVAERAGMHFAPSITEFRAGGGVSVTIQSLQGARTRGLLNSIARTQRWFVITDYSTKSTKSLTAIVDKLLAANVDSRALFLSHGFSAKVSVEAEFSFGTELIVGSAVVNAGSTESRIATFAPSFALLRSLQHRGVAAVDELTWRQFEQLIATLLEADGYSVELLRGSKDGGVDVVAVKDLGVHGYFKAVWQAKKRSLKNRVGLSVVRGLADTRAEFGATKGIIVTSSYLTRGALQRIERDKYMLGKVDREELTAWIQKTLFGHIPS
jgi:HJR/Mrr/RecB family endonuclease